AAIGTVKKGVHFTYLQVSRPHTRKRKAPRFQTGRKGGRRCETRNLAAPLVVLHTAESGHHAGLDGQAALVVVHGTGFYVRFRLHFQFPSSDFAALLVYAPKRRN